MPSLHDRLAHAGDVLAAAGIPRDEAARDAELLARHVLGWDRGGLHLRRRDPTPDGFTDRYQPLVDRRAAREPIAYILGRQEFRGLDFDVTPDVLIPRPETELIVDEAIAWATGRPGPLRVVDVGTGSGCIAVAIAREIPTARVVATDISRAALAVASRNVRRHGVARRVHLVETDLLAGVGTADLIVANPPYVARAIEDDLQPEVGRYEPAAALFGGADGRTVLSRLLATSAAHLAANGLLVVEFGFDQGTWLPASAIAAGWQIVDIRQDLQSIPRVLVARR